MREILSTLKTWYRGGVPTGLATVVGVRRSAPRQPGASMATTPDGQVAGSVSGGCVEGAVYEVCQQVLSTGTPELVSYGISDDQAFSVGLTCGGEIDVFVEPVDAVRQPYFLDLADSIEHGDPIALATVLRGPSALGAKLVVWEDRTAGTLGDPGLDAAVTDDARGMLQLGTTGQRGYGPSGQRRQDDVDVFIESFAPRSRMLVFGAIDFAAAVARIGTFLGYYVVVCDAREVFATPRRFPEADEVVVEWPHKYLARTMVDGRTVICVLTHDPKFDVPLLELALRTPAAYIGAMGSRRTHEDRLERLRERGMTDSKLARLHSPIGLDISASTPEETAVSVAAEIIQTRSGSSGLSLGATGGAIHKTTTPAGG